MMKYKIAAFLLILFVFMVTSSYCATFEGKVIDADTKEPLVGAVVVASWRGEQGTVTGGTSRLEDVKETLTDRNGEWTIKGPKGTSNEFLENVFSILTLFTGTYYTKPPAFIVFKPSYCSFPKGFEIDSCKGKIKTYNGKNEYIGEIVELPALTNREDRRMNRSISLPDAKTMQKKLINLIKLLDEEDAYLYPGRQGKSRRVNSLLEDARH